MLFQEKIFTKWNSRTKKYYENLGYIYSFMGDDFLVEVSDLMKNSSERVLVKCDYCGEIYDIVWAHRTKIINNNYPSSSKDACYDCKAKKAKEVVFEKYGVSNIFNIPGAKEKQAKTNLEIFGVENVFQNNKIKKKIKKTNIKKYGFPSYTQTEEYRVKSKITNNERYGADSWMQTGEGREYFSGENSPVWKGGINDPRWDRLKKEYRDWRFSIFKIYNFSCDICGNNDYVEAHHLYNYKDYPDLRYEKGNGVCLCQPCHIDFHRKYGKKNNTPEQYFEYKKSVQI